VSSGFGMTPRSSWITLLLLVSCEGTLDAGRNQVGLAPNEVEAGGVTPPTGTTTGSPQPSIPSSSPSMPDSGGPTGTTQPPNDAGMSTPSEPAVSGSTDNTEAGADPFDAGALDAGSPALPPISPQSPVVVVNDLATDNWQGELTLLAASTDRINLAGLVVNNSDYWPDLEFNRDGWQQMVDAASESGMRNVPDLVVSESPALVAPASGEIDATVPNDSVGGRFIRDAALRLGTVEQPLVVVTGSTLTDVADAYLLDNTIASRLVVVAAMGQPSEQGARMGGPNGELDIWSAAIVAQRLRFVQNIGYYEQSQDVPEARVAELPDNAFGAWMASKQPEVTLGYAADQIGLLAVVLPGFASEFRNATYVGWVPGEPSDLRYQADGNCWIVPLTDGALATQFLWEMLQDPDTFGG
jgi:hypothetical protein